MTTIWNFIICARDSKTPGPSSLQAVINAITANSLQSLAIQSSKYFSAILMSFSDGTVVPAKNLFERKSRKMRRVDTLTKDFHTPSLERKGRSFQNLE
jgi:hypothetical protein